MEHVVIASVQQRIRVFSTLDNYRNELLRFTRIAQHKNASLVVFPELGATMLMPPALHDLRTQLLKHAERGRHRRAPFLHRYTATVSGWVASRLPVSFTDILSGYLEGEGVGLWQTYCEFFGGLAKKTALTIVAPSGYLPDPIDGTVRNISGVFGPDGALLGYQPKVMLHERDRIIGKPGLDWNVIQTAVGKLGLLLGNDMLYPEVGRLFAYKGAEILVGQAACATTVSYQKMRAALLERMQDNQLFATASFLVGNNDMSGQPQQQYVGRSAIFAPQELTPRFNGILVEMASPNSEGVLSAEWKYPDLRQLWIDSGIPAHKQRSPQQTHRMIASLYARLHHAQTERVSEKFDDESIPLTDDALRASSIDSKHALRLDELPVTTTITRRWPLNKVDYSTVDSLATEMPEFAGHQSPVNGSDTNRSPHSSPISHSTAEDETEEMDALPGSHDDEL